MKLYDEEELRKKNEKNRKMRNLILVSIIFTVLLIILLMGVIYYLIYNPDRITISLNGNENAQIEQMIITKNDDDGNTIVYYPIREISSIFGYNSNDGDYGRNVENTEDCYIESENEVAIFKENSNLIYKIDKTINNADTDYKYEEVKIGNLVIKEKDKLYVDTEGLEEAFNLSISTNKRTKKINITVLDQLITSAQSYLKNNKIGVLDEKFSNHKALLDNMIVIENEELRKKGVIDYSTKEEILGFQYDDITYIPSKESFLIKKDDKVGIIGSDRISKIKPQYDNLILIDNENGLYLAEDSGFFGVIDENGNTKIYIEYSKIGVDINDFKDNDLKNRYVLLGNLIPVKKDDMWMFYKIESSKNADGSMNVQCSLIQNDKFTDIGCKAKATRGTVSNLMVLKDYGMVIVQKQGTYYGFMNQDGILPIGVAFTDIYMETTSGKTDYYMVYFKDGKTYDVIEALEKAGYKKINND